MNSPSSSETSASKTEIENLLGQMSAGGEPAPNAGEERPGQELTDRHQFPRHSLFSDNEFRKLKDRQDEFVDSLAGRLSLHLGVEVSLQLMKLDTLSFREFKDGLSIPTHVTLLKLESLPETCLLVIPPPLGLCMVDRELGNTTGAQDEAREIGRIEARILSKIVEMIAAEWCKAWKDVLALRPTLLKYENNARFLQTYPPDTTLLVLGIESKIGETTGQIQFAFPYPALEPLIQKLNADDEPATKPASAAPVQNPKWNPVFSEVTIPVTAALSEIEVTARQLAELKTGDVIPIPPAIASQVQVCLAGTPKFIGTLGTSDGLWAVKLDQPLRELQA